MKKGLISFCLIFSFFLLIPNAQAEVGPRAKIMGMMAIYGTTGGALLGVASLAFGTEGRSIAKGASLGLYAGLLFGSYVIISHQLRNRQSAPEEYDSGVGGGAADSYSDYSTEERYSSAWRTDFHFRNFERGKNYGPKKVHNEQVFNLELIQIQF